jgi:hypothetical protein
VSYDSAILRLADGDPDDLVHRRTKRGLVREGLAVWIDRYEGDVALTPLGEQRAAELIARARAVLERHIIGPQ